jgi:VanZ family protein
MGKFLGQGNLDRLAASEISRKYSSLASPRIGSELLFARIGQSATLSPFESSKSPQAARLCRIRIMPDPSTGDEEPRPISAKGSIVDGQHHVRLPLHGLYTVIAADVRGPLNSERRPLTGTRRSKTPRRGQRVYLGFAALGSLVYLYASMMPFGFSIQNWPPPFMAVEPPSFAERAQRFDVFMNVLAFVPLGFLWSAAIQLTGSRSRDHLVWLTFWQSALLCLALAILGEGAQFLIPPRIASIWDILALETGGLTGGIVWIQMQRSNTIASCRTTQRVLHFRPPATGLRTALNYGVAICGCVLVRIAMHPTECFRVYQQRDLLALGDLIQKSAMSWQILPIFGAIAILISARRLFGNRLLAQPIGGAGDAPGVGTSKPGQLGTQTRPMAAA